MTEDTAKAVKECQAGRVEFKIDKGSNLHVSCGKLSFEGKALGENVNAVIESVSRARPAGQRQVSEELRSLSHIFTWNSVGRGGCSCGVRGLNEEIYERRKSFSH